MAEREAGNTDADLAFAGLKVVEFAQGVAAPYCGMLLARNGADVVKIEPPGGDWSRALRKQYGEMSADAVVLLRGKRSLALDLKHEDGRRIALDLAAGADVVIENYRPGVIERLGLDYETVRARNPKVVYVSVTGFGAVGPNRDRPATDSVMQGYTGLMSINRDGEGVPRRQDLLTVDMASGLYIFHAVAAALYRRAVKGLGKRIVTSLLECTLAFQEAKIIEFALVGSASSPVGAPVGTFATADGYISLNARRDKHFAALCAILGTPEWLEDPRFRSLDTRFANSAVLNPLVADFVATRPTADWLDVLTKADILHAPVFDYADLFEDAQVEAIGAFRWEEVPDLGRIPASRLPGLDFPREGDPRGLSPGIGAHGREILAELGLADDDVERHRETGAVARL